MAGADIQQWPHQQLQPWSCSKAAVSSSTPGLVRLKAGFQRRTKLQTFKAVSEAVSVGFPVATWNDAMLLLRQQHLEQQALEALRLVTDEASGLGSPAFPCALIAGDVVLLHLLHRLGVLQSGRVKVIFIDTFHLFPETYEFLTDCEKRFSFQAHIFHAAGVENKAEYQAQHGSDLFIRDIDEYDRICKVEPFGRALRELGVDAMINGRRRDHGAERASLEVFEGGGGVGDGVLKVQPLAYWEFWDCFAYLERHGVPAHPLHAQGYPSLGDVQTTLPVPRDKWFLYGGERSGRFQGLRNQDGSDKTECGIHVGDASAAPSGTSSSPSSDLAGPPSSSISPPSSTWAPPAASPQ